MGREYRLQGDARLRQESTRRTPRVSAPVCATIRQYHFDSNGVVAGIDVGEDFLDIAQIGRDRTIELSRIDLRTIASSSQAIKELARRIVDHDGLEPGAIAIVDSPRWPRDLDYSRRGVRKRDGDWRSRAIDTALRRIVRATIHQSVALFPTPAMNYFIGHLNRAGCKPHLRTFGDALFAAALKQNLAATGGTFTRFMITGFATYRALAMLGIASYEGYPDLQFRLWNGSRPLTSKSGGRLVALAQRQEIVTRVAKQLRCAGHEAIMTLDQADATILALSAVATVDEGVGVMLTHRAEGRLLVTFPAEVGVAFEA